MKINFITSANDSIASYRYHILLPARQLIELGHEVTISPSPNLDDDIYIFSKHFNYGEQGYIRKLKEGGKKTVFHCCDNHFASKHENHYRTMIEGADTVIGSTFEMVEIIRKETGKDAVLIPDACEYEQAEPEFNPRLDATLLKVLWFGHHGNIGALADLMPIEGVELRLCTSEQAISKLPKELSGIPALPWSFENQKRAWKWCDVVIIPTYLTEDKWIKSHNRLTESVRQGKYVIANALPSYQEFKEWMYIGDIKDGLKWVKQNPQTIKLQISECQKYIENNYSPVIIGKRWQEVLCQNL